MKTSNRTLTSLAPLASLAALLGVPALALATPLQATAVQASGTPLPAGATCTAEALNVTGFANPDGSFAVFNVPTNQGAIRIRATCSDPFGVTTSGQSSLITPVSGTPLDAGDLDFGSVVPVAASLSISPTSSTLVGFGQTLQLAVGSTFADLSTGVVTAGSTGTVYRTSNPNVVTIDADGLVTAVGTGTALVSALNEGALGLATINVLSASLQSVDVAPMAVELVVNPIYGTPTATLSVTGQLSDASTTNLTSAMGGTTYTSSDPTVAVASPDGMILGISSGYATITVTAGQPAMTTQVPVLVTAYSPSALASYNTPGHAYDVDVAGNLAFVADGAAGLQIIDTTGGTTVGKLAFTGQTVVDVRVRGQLAAVALGTGGFGLVDIADPAQPALLSQLTASGSVAGVSLSGDRLYLATSIGVDVYDVANPYAPALVGSHTLAFPANAVSGDATRGLVAVATAEPAVVIVQTNGALPWSGATVTLPPATNAADDVLLHGTSVYVANGTMGVSEIDVTAPGAPYLEASSTLTFNALGVALSQTAEGTVIAAADNMFVNAVPLFDKLLANTYNVDFSALPGIVQYDANSSGVALGNGFGVVSVGAAGIQVFRTQQLTDNAGLAPTVSLTQPIDGVTTTSGGAVFLSATATDDVAVAFVDFTLDGVALGTDSAAPFATTVLAPAPCSTHSLVATATDVGGNVGQSIAVTLDVLCADGQPCAVDADCASGDCGGGTCQSCSPGVSFPSCAAYKAACPAAASGARDLDPDGSGPGAPFTAYCEMNLGGGGWTLVSKLSNQDSKHWVDAKSSWTSAAPYGNTVDLSPGADAKSEAWGTVPVTEFLLSDDQNYSSGLYIETLSGCVGGMTLDQYFTTALANYPNTASQNYFRQCATYNNYLPFWTTDPNWIGQTALSPSLSLKHGYFTIAYTDGGDTQAVFSFYAFEKIWWGPDFVSTATEFEADVGLGESEQNGVAFSPNDGQMQDVGSASSCGFNDASCASFYPQTVYLFGR
jgi:hypothetical protein